MAEVNVAVQSPLEQKVDNHESRIGNLEIRIAINENNTANLEKKLDKIDNNISKLTWIVVSAVILAVLNIVFKGGV